MKTFILVILLLLSLGNSIQECEDVNIVTTFNSIHLKWKYKLNISNLTSHFNGCDNYMPSDCTYPDETDVFKTLSCNSNDCEITIPNVLSNARYELLLALPERTLSCNVNTKKTNSELVRNATVNFETNTNTDAYDVKAEISWGFPCHPNSDVHAFQVSLISKDKTIVIPVDKNFTQNILTVNTPISISLKNIKIEIKTAVEGNDPLVLNVTPPSGVPPLVKTFVPYINVNMHHAKITFDPDIFSNENGEVEYFALIIAAKKMSSDEKKWNYLKDASWPTVEKPLTEVTPNFWKPSKNSKGEIEYYIGDDKCDCNPPLESNTVYSIKVRAVTLNAYRDSHYVYFKTMQSESTEKKPLGLILGLTLGTLIMGVILVILINRKKGHMRWYQKKNPVPKSIPVKKFQKHFITMVETSGRLSNEFILLESLTETKYSTQVAQRTPKKNRYRNILPFDYNRVELETNYKETNDYINASFIKGHSGREYIATQGPTINTTTDFWRMILQQSVTLIVMLTRLYEDGMEKCFKYYPTIDQELQFGDIKISCTKEINHISYVEREFLIEKEQLTKTVTHLYFAEWEDFGAPATTEVTLQFCCVLRKIKNDQPGLVVVHCSAGVGRTGTLLAIDILLTNVKNNKKINIFDTVFKLREQRMSMVQNVNQYKHIYMCVNDAIKQPHLFQQKIDSAPQTDTIIKEEDESGI